MAWNKLSQASPAAPKPWGAVNDAVQHFLRSFTVGPVTH
jgi:hypothetical protein